MRQRWRSPSQPSMPISPRCLSHGRPLRPDGSLLGALTASFDLDELCDFLGTLRVGKGEGGYAFVVEYRADGSRRVIAHPRPEILLRERTEGSRRHRELVPVEALEDAVVQDFLGQLPSSYTPAGQEGVGEVASAACTRPIWARMRFVH